MSELCIELGGKAMQVYNLDLQELPLFRDVSPEEVERFITATGATIERVGKGKRILEAYEENHNIGVIVESGHWLDVAVVDGVDHVEIFLWQRIVGIDKLDHQVLHHAKAYALAQVIERD